MQYTSKDVKNCLLKEKKKKEEKENEDSVTCLKLGSNFVLESRLLLKVLIQADTSEQMRAENGSTWVSWSKTNSTVRTQGI